MRWSATRQAQRCRRCDAGRSARPARRIHSTPMANAVGHPLPGLVRTLEAWLSRRSPDRSVCPPSTSSFVKGGEDPAVLVAHRARDRAGARQPRPGGSRIPRSSPGSSRSPSGRASTPSPSSGPAPSAHSLPGRPLAPLPPARDGPPRRRARQPRLRPRRRSGSPASTPSSPVRRRRRGPEELLALADEILRGVFEGDLGLALDRAAAFCRVTADGCTRPRGRRGRHRARSGPRRSPGAPPGWRDSRRSSQPAPGSGATAF